MKSLQVIVAVLAGFMVSGVVAAAEQTGAMIAFGEQGVYRGYCVPGTEGEKLPGLVLIHEWWGLNDSIKAEAEQYARAGFNVLAVDLFGKVAATPEEARQQVQALNQPAATAQLLAAAAYLRTRLNASGRVGSLGWCFGGGQSLTLALNDPRLDAAVIYYGQPVVDPRQLAQIKAPVLGHFGETDQSIPLARVTEFRQALTTAVIAHVLYTYPGAGHAFANPTNTNAYHREAATLANTRTVDFLNRYLK